MEKVIYVAGAIGGILGTAGYLLYLFMKDKKRKRYEAISLEHQLHMQQAKYLGYYCCVPILAKDKEAQ